ncbi:MAG: hypothetical protein CVT59_07440 [Actinobacteria bacterium HGW-Actinobacteria-1]|jgi:hypothetical protein|nr:MAG: hypothetical protein CVT59_07440 [Actinobacteria bacterium HGW-Actinobacteria-1]
MTSSTAARPGAIDYALEVAAAAVTAALLGYAFGAGARWLLDLISGTQGLQDIARALMGGLLGLVVGAPLGPWTVARYRSRPFSVWKGYAGAIVGAVLGLVVVSIFSMNDAAGAGPWAAFATVIAGTVVLGNLHRRSA